MILSVALPLALRSSSRLLCLLPPPLLLFLPFLPRLRERLLLLLLLLPLLRRTVLQGGLLRYLPCLLLSLLSLPLPSFSIGAHFSPFSLFQPPTRPLPSPASRPALRDLPAVGNVLAKRSRYRLSLPSSPPPPLIPLPLLLSSLSHPSSHPSRSSWTDQASADAALASKLSEANITISQQQAELGNQSALLAKLTAQVKKLEEENSLLLSCVVTGSFFIASSFSAALPFLSVVLSPLSKTSENYPQKSIHDARPLQTTKKTSGTRPLTRMTAGLIASRVTLMKMRRSSSLLVRFFFSFLFSFSSSHRSHMQKPILQTRSLMKIDHTLPSPSPLPATTFPFFSFWKLEFVLSFCFVDDEVARRDTWIPRYVVCECVRASMS